MLRVANRDDVRERTCTCVREAAQAWLSLHSKFAQHVFVSPSSNAWTPWKAKAIFRRACQLLMVRMCLQYNVFTHARSVLLGTACRGSNVIYSGTLQQRLKRDTSLFSSFYTALELLTWFWSFAFSSNLHVQNVTSIVANLMSSQFKITS